MIIETSLIVKTNLAHHVQPSLSLNEVLNSFKNLMVANKENNRFISNDKNYLYFPRISPDGTPITFDKSRDQYIVYEDYIFDTNSFILRSNVVSDALCYLYIDIRHPAVPSMSVNEIKIAMTRAELEKVYEDFSTGLSNIFKIPNVLDVNIGKIIFNKIRRGYRFGTKRLGILDEECDNTYLADREFE